MAKKNAEKPKRELTKRQLSRRQRQQRRQRIIFIVGISVIVAVLAVIGAGVYTVWYLPKYKPLHETVIEVNDTKLDMEYYTKMLEYMMLQYSSYGISITTDVMTYLAYYVETAVEQGELIRQAAMKLGISVSDEEVDEVLETAGYDPQAIEDYRDLFRTQLLVERLTDEYFEGIVPMFAEQRFVMVMFLESEEQANEVKARVENGEDFGMLAAEFSLEDVSKEASGILGWMPQDILPLVIDSPVLEENVFSCEVGVVTQPLYEEDRTKEVGYWLIEILERTGVEEEEVVEEEAVEEEAVEEEAVEEEEEAVEEEEAEEEVPVEVKVRLMLLGSEQEANEVIAKLEAGEDFAELASEYSQHDESKENGGEFEVWSDDTLTSAFSEFVFDPEVELNKLSQPIRDEEVTTEGGYWLIWSAFSDDNRQIDDDDRELLMNKTVENWVLGLMDDPEYNVVSYLDEEKIAWAISYVMTGGVVE